MFETGKRWRVPYLLYLLVAIIVAEIAFNGEFPPAKCPHHSHLAEVAVNEEASA